MDWIDLEEQAPEDEQRCVVFTEDGDYKTARYNEDTGLFEELEWFDELTSVKAWMPLNECTI